MLLVPPVSWTNRFRLTCGFAGDGFPGLDYLLAGAMQGPAGAVSLVVVVDDLVAVLRGGPGGPGPGEDVPVGDVRAGMLAPPTTWIDERHIGRCEREEPDRLVTVDVRKRTVLRDPRACAPPTVVTGLVARPRCGVGGGDVAGDGFGAGPGVALVLLVSGGG